MESKSKHVSEKARKDCIFRIKAQLARLIINHGFFGIIATQLKTVENNTIQTMATDGKHMYYNVEFVMGVSSERKSEIDDRVEEHIKKENLDKKEADKLRDLVDRQTRGLTDDELLFVMVHEVMHCAMEHMVRRGGRDPKRWNEAADYAINQMISDEGIGKMPEYGLIDARFKSKAAEEIYKILEEEGGEPEEPLDEHMDGSSSGDGEGGESRGTMSDIMDEEGNRPQPSEAEIEANAENFKDVIKQAVQTSSNAPAEIERMVEKLNKPKINWQAKLHRTMKSHIKRDSSFQRPNRRGFALAGHLQSMGQMATNRTMVLPGLLPEEDIDIAVGLDTSGSISNLMLRDFISEVVGITKQYQQFKIRLFCWDTAVHNVKDFTASNAHEMLSYELKGFGGTTVGCCWQMFEEDNYKPKQFICFTDGYFWEDNLSEYANYCPTLWVVHSNEGFVAPFGEAITYEWEHEEA